MPIEVMFLKTIQRRSKVFFIFSEKHEDTKLNIKCDPNFYSYKNSSFYNWKEIYQNIK